MVRAKYIPHHYIYMIEVGQEAPEIQLPDQNGNIHKLSDYRGQWVLLYFYPKDDTPGCTKEACAIRDDFANFESLKAKVLGVSTDSVASHKKFADKYNLPFTLLSDEERDAHQKYDIKGRTSFLINPHGKIAKIYEKVKPEVHAQEVLHDVDTLSQEL